MRAATTARTILTLNAGSSSVKFGAFRAREGALQVLLRGEIEGVATSPHLKAKDERGAVLIDAALPGPYDAAVGEAVGRIDALPEVAGLSAVGHRVVHGGERLVEPVRIDERVRAELEALVPLAPLHEPHNIAGIDAVARAHPLLPQVACFDTAFHAGAPREARRFAVSAEVEALGVRRYGFHGLSYEFVSGRLAELLPPERRRRAVIAHLGSGASMCALRDGASIATTMSFSALDGLPMGTRCGSLDPEAVLYLIGRGWDAARISHELWERSGLLGLSKTSADVRDLLASSAPAAREALDFFAYRAARELGSLVAALGGLDVLAFTAGIGEHAAAVRANISERSAWLGIALDSAANDAGAERLDAETSRVAVYRIPTDEEQVVARHTAAVIASSASR